MTPLAVIMLERGFRHLPIVKASRPTGVLSVRDMLRHITQLCKS